MCVGELKPGSSMTEQRHRRPKRAVLVRRHHHRPVVDRGLWRNHCWISILLLFILMASNNNNQSTKNGGGPGGSGGMLVQGAETILTADQISVEWRFSLENSVLQQGNAIVVWKDWVYATTSSGTLYRLPRQFPNGNNIFKDNKNEDNGVLQFAPTNSNNSNISCRSCAIVVEGMIIYVVVEEISDSKSSRILSVDASTMKLQWSLLLEDNTEIMGTPVVGGNNNKYLYASHYSSSQGGKLTVIKLGDSTTEASIAATLDLATDRVTPPAIARNETDTNDVVYVAATADDGNGQLWSISWSDQHETLGGVGSQAYVVATVSDLASSALAPPAVTVKGGVYLGQDESLVLGWANAKNGEALPDWGYSLQLGTDNANAPIPVAPVLSQDEQYLFVAAAGPALACLELDEGRSSWVVSTDQPLTALPVYFRNDYITDTSSSGKDVLYVADGNRLRQYDAIGGTVLWEQSFCDSRNDCPDIRANFALSPNGNVLYYGDSQGTVVAVRVGGEPTLAPTAAPTTTKTTTTTSAPSIPALDSAPPVKEPTPSPVAPSVPLPPSATMTINDNSDAFDNFGQEGTSTSSSSAVMDLLPAILGAVCAVLFVLIGIVIVLRRRGKTSRKCMLGLNHHRVRDDETSDEDEEMARRHLHEQLAQVLQLPTNRAVGLTSIAETPENFNEDGTVDDQSVGYEVKSVASDVDGNMSSIFDTFSVTSGTSTNNNKKKEEEDERTAGLSTTEESGLASVRSTSAIRSGSDDKSKCAILKDNDTDYRVASATSRESTSTAMSLNTTGLVAAAGAAVSLLSEKVTSSSAQDPKNSSSPESMENRCIRGTKSNDQTNGVSPLPSPTPSYVSNEPGRISGMSPVNNNSSSNNNNNKTFSSQASLASYDESLYIDESTIDESRPEIITGDEPLLEEALDPNGQAVDADECPEDEVMGKVLPGSHYLSRHKAKKEQAGIATETSQRILKRYTPETLAVAPIAPAPPPPPPSLPVMADAELELKVNRSRPIYRGVSVRSSRTRAGLFSRRSHVNEDHRKEQGNDVVVQEATPTLESTERRNLRRSVSPSSVTSSQPKEGVENDDDESSEPSPPVFTKTGYYVEESEKKQQESSMTSALDPWSSFLNELSKVEDQFFNLTTPKKNPENGRKERQKRSSVRKTESSDSESLEPPPPAPRTFYA